MLASFYAKAQGSAIPSTFTSRISIARRRSKGGAFALPVLAVPFVIRQWALGRFFLTRRTGSPREWVDARGWSPEPCRPHPLGLSGGPKASQSRMVARDARVCERSGSSLSERSIWAELGSFSRASSDGSNKLFQAARRSLPLGADGSNPAPKSNIACSCGSWGANGALSRRKKFNRSSRADGANPVDAKEGRKGDETLSLFGRQAHAPPVAGRSEACSAPCARMSPNDSTTPRAAVQNVMRGFFF